jgi:hypothetical protein
LRRTKPTSSEAPLDRPVDDFVGAGVLSALLAYLPVPFGAKVIDLREHTGQKLFRGFRRDTRTLEVPNLLPLPQYLATHVFDFSARGWELHEVPPELQ